MQVRSLKGSYLTIAETRDLLVCLRAHNGKWAVGDYLFEA